MASRPTEGHRASAALASAQTPRTTPRRSRGGFEEDDFGYVASHLTERIVDFSGVESGEPRTWLEWLDREVSVTAPHGLVAGDVVGASTPPRKHRPVTFVAQEKQRKEEQDKGGGVPKK